VGCGDEQRLLLAAVDDLDLEGAALFADDLTGSTVEARVVATVRNARVDLQVDFFPSSYS